MPSPYATAEDSKSLWLERSNYIATHIAAIAYGFHATVLFAIVHLMFQPTTRRRDRRRAGWLFLSVIFFVAGTIHLACSIEFNESAWVTEREYPGGPFAFLTEQQGRPIPTAGSGAFAVIAILSEALLLYRVSVLWNRRWYIMLPLGLFYITTIVLLLLRIAQLHVKSVPPMVDLGVITWTSLMAINVALSGMIALRILLMRRSIGRMLGPEYTSVYTGTAALVIEAALPFVIVSIILLALFGGRDTSQYLFIPLLGQIMCIAPLLIILRIFRNQAWSINTARTLHEQAPTAKTGKTPAPAPLGPLTFVVSPSTGQSGGVGTEEGGLPMQENRHSK